VLLVIGKFTLGSSGFSVSFGIKHTFNFFNPGFAFILAALPVVLFIAKDSRLAFGSLGLSFKRTFEPFLVIAAMSVLVQLMINSGHNLSGIASSLGYLAENFKISLLPFVSPFIGAFGSFLTGSATISNIMFGNLLASAALALGQSTAWILSLELVGGAAGNMIALADILSAEAVVGLKEKTREVLKGVIIPCLIYVFLIGLIGLLFLEKN
jgi:lactate permease